MNRPGPEARRAGWVTTAPMPIDDFGGSAVSDGWVFGGYSFSAGQNLDTTYRYTGLETSGRSMRRCPTDT